MWLFTSKQQTWAFSFAEHFINSVVPVHELMEAGLIDEHVLLRPDLNARPMGRYGFYQMLSALSAERTAGLRTDLFKIPPMPGDQLSLF